MNEEHRKPKTVVRWKCTCSYDGSDYAGWQIQGKGHLSVQQVIEESLQQTLKEAVGIHGSGRTDAGVHALEQVFHFDFDWKHDEQSLLRALNAKLPSDVLITSAVSVDSDFHARFSAVSKRYHYRLVLGQTDPFRCRYSWSISEKTDLNRIADGLTRLVGKHDFAAFSANRGVAYESTVRHLSRAQVTQDADYVYLSFEADGFMYKMVRSLVGTLVNLGQGRLEKMEIDRLLVSPARTPLVLVAPACGLFLEKVRYS